MEKYGYEWIMWSDGDAMFLNFNKSLEEHLDGNFDVIYPSSNPESKWRSVINTGHFLVHNTPWSYKFFWQAYGLSFVDCWEYLAGKPAINGWLKLCFARGRPLWNDQRVLQYFISYTPWSEYGKHFKHVCMESFNSEFPNYWQGDLVVHFPGKSIELKESLLGKLIEFSNCEDGSVDWNAAPELKGQDANVRKVPQSAYDILNSAEGWEKKQ